MTELPASTCQNCRFYLTNPQDASQGLCRRHPPIPVLTNLQRSSESGQITGSESLSLSPIVRAIGWCGEWKPATSQ